METKSIYDATKERLSEHPASAAGAIEFVQDAVMCAETAARELGASVAGAQKKQAVTQLFVEKNRANGNVWKQVMPTLGALIEFGVAMLNAAVPEHVANVVDAVHDAAQDAISGISAEQVEVVVKKACCCLPCFKKKVTPDKKSVEAVSTEAGLSETSGGAGNVENADELVVL